MSQYREIHGPFRYPIGRKIGSGKDNKVYEFRHEQAAGAEYADEFPRYVGEAVIKASNKPRRREKFSPEAAFADAKYKKAKYELLKRFLGDYVPNSAFVVGNMQSGGQDTIKSYTLQERLPRFMLSELTTEQRNSDILRGNIYGLVTRLQIMHQVLARAKDIVEGQGDEFLVENSLDLGEFSNFVRDNKDAGPETLSYKHLVNGFQSSPNLLVNPETLEIYCIDFGKGQWTPQMDAQLGVVYDIVAHDPKVSEKLAA